MTKKTRTKTKNTLTEWIVCGRMIGSASGWDQSETFMMTLYDFSPLAGYRGPSGDVLFKFENGTIEAFNEDGSIKESVDLIDAIRGLPVARTNSI